MPEGDRPARRRVIAPNLLSALRMALGVSFPLLSPRWWPLIVVAAAVSDFADGFIARRFGATTSVGGLLDTLADKLFALLVLFTLVGRSQLAPWQVLLLLGRDVVVAAVAGTAALRHRWSAFLDMPPRPLGKLTTAGIFAFLFLGTLLPAHPVPVGAGFAVAAALSMAAAVDYFGRFLRVPRAGAMG